MATDAVPPAHPPAHGSPSSRGSAGAAPAQDGGGGGTSTAARGDGGLCGIGEAASRLGVSERALRYYQQIGLLTPSARTAGGLRRYSLGDLERVGRIRELQDLLGFNLDEIRSVLATEDRRQHLRAEYQQPETSPTRRRELIEEGLALQDDLLRQVEAKLARLERFRSDLAATAARFRVLLESGTETAAAEVGRPEASAPAAGGGPR